ncbi:MAG: hypothetical protein HXX19_04550 [Rhodoferax sp.]|nr:hypothetical protein [Rhodoferax sp.]
MEANPPLKRAHARRLRDVYRSAGWPYQDLVELELLAAGLLEQVVEPSGHTTVRLTETGVRYVAESAGQNRQTRSAHEDLVEQVAREMMREGRIVWTGLSLRARVTNSDGEGNWKWCMPDVFSIRNSSVEAYLEPVVHEIKVNRADLLGDLKRPEKRQAYLDVGGQCWYVLGRDTKGRPIGLPEEIPVECGVMIVSESGIEVVRTAPKRPSVKLPFMVWMALAKAAPMDRNMMDKEGLRQIG